MFLDVHKLFLIGRSALQDWTNLIADITDETNIIPGIYFIKKPPKHCYSNHINVKNNNN